MGGWVGGREGGRVGGWVGGRVGGWVGSQVMANATTKCACSTRTTRLIGPPAGCEKIFFAFFVPQPAKNYTSQTSWELLQQHNDRVNIFSAISYTYILSLCIDLVTSKSNSNDSPI